MAMYLATDTELTSIADAIRTKGGTAVSLPFPDGFISAINSIPTGITPTGTSVITANGVYDVTSFASASVSVPTGITPTGTYSVSANGIYDITNYASVDVNVSGGGGDTRFIDLIERTPTSWEDSTITKIAGMVFWQYTTLISVSFPNCLSIGASTFYGCSNLASVYLPSLNNLGTNGAFGNCSYLSYISLPCLSGEIPQYAFQNCQRLGSETAITFNASKVGTSAFGGCSRMVSINLPECKSLANYAFVGCSKLTDVSIPKVTWVGTYAFSSCSTIKEMWLPVCSTISGGAFRNCRSLESLYLLSTSVVTLSTSVFLSTPFNASSWIGRWGSIFVPSSLVSSYKIATNWSSIADRITAYVE